MQHAGFSMLTHSVEPESPHSLAQNSLKGLWTWQGILHVHALDTCQQMACIFQLCHGVQVLNQGS